MMSDVNPQSKRPAAGRSNPLLLVCLGFGLLGGLLFPLYASIFITWNQATDLGFLMGCVAGGVAFGGLFYAIFSVMVGKNLRQVAKVVDAVGSGDLSVRCPVDSSDMLAGIAVSVNKMTSCLNRSIGQIAESTNQVSLAVKNMSVINLETASSIVQQHSSSDQTAVVMTEMSETAREVARNADAAAKATHDADVAAQNGAELATKAMGGIQALSGEVEKASQVIQKLEQDSQSISVILEVIQGIAEQTNLLALNAAIEAARAGEQGRGFAVVADEVRTLASRTQQSTEEIKHMIEKLQVGAGDAVKVMETARNKAQVGQESVEQAVDSLTAIGGAVATIDEMNTQIASAAKEQDTVAEELSQNINSISSVAGNAGSGAELSNASGVEIQQLVSQLADEVSKFKR